MSTREPINDYTRSLIMEGRHPRLRGDISRDLHGHISSDLHGDISRGLYGDISDLHGDISGGLHGDIRDLYGYISIGLYGDISGLRGDISGLRGYICSDLRGEISGLYGHISRDLRGDISRDLHGDISSDLRGDISGLYGHISRDLHGDIGGLRGDSSDLHGDISDLRGDISAGQYPNLSADVASEDEIKRLDEIRTVLLRQPKRLDMSLWHSGNWRPAHTPEEEHQCGSTHCIAGWLQALCEDKDLRDMIPERAGRLLAPASAHMFFSMSNERVLSWLKDRSYARVAGPGAK